MVRTASWVSECVNEPNVFFYWDVSAEIISSPILMQLINKRLAK